MRYLIWIAVFIAGVRCAAADTGKTLQAAKAASAISVDGFLTDAAWQHAPVASQFVQTDPVNGAPSRFRTEVRVLYDREAIYIGATLFDSAPDSILKQLGRRDAGQINADMFGVFLDTYNDKQNAFAFEVSASGVQTDIRMYGTSEDLAWDAVWQSAVRITSDGWEAEIMIPYSAIRLPKTPLQSWGINFMRIVRRTREKSYWNFVDTSRHGFINQFGELQQLELEAPPLRLSLTPYVSGFVQHSPGATEAANELSYSFGGGMDVKYGINESFTLDMTLVPDFRQVQYDNQILNLSPFEVQFNENRPFFTEGTELFNKGGIFYSRRIGGQPLLYHKAAQKGDKIISNPAAGNLVNATKITGRTRSKLGIGFFNAITRNTFATVTDSLGHQRQRLTDPAANYSVVVLDQALPDNSYVTFTNTNVTRSQGFYHANVSGLQLRLANQGNRYALRAGGNLSQHYRKGEDLQPLQLGHQYHVQLAKVSGNWQYSLGHNLESDNYNPNDLGFLQRNNFISYSASVKYSVFRPFWRLLNFSTTISSSYQQLYLPRRFAGQSITWSTGGRFRNFLSFGSSLAITPVRGNDFFEARVPGQLFAVNPGAEGSIWISSDYRRRLAIDASAGLARSPRYDQTYRSFSLSPRFRVSDKLLLIARGSVNNRWRDIGFAGFGSQKEIYFGARQRNTFETTLSGSYIFTASNWLTLNMRHYWSRVRYQEFYQLLPDGGLLPEQHFTASHINSNIFNLDLVYTWRFAPGSEISIVWKDAIFTRSQHLTTNYLENLSGIVNSPQTNSFSVKVLYYLDYRQLQRLWHS